MRTIIFSNSKLRCFSHLVLSVFMFLGISVSAQQLAGTAGIDWVRVADYSGGALYGASAFTIDDYAYVCMGSSGGYVETYKKTCYRYDPAKDVWKRMADLPSTAVNRTDGVGFCIDGKGYITGGDYRPLAGINYPVDMWEYNPGTNLWYQRANFPRKGGMWNGTAFTIGSLAYVGLGYAGFYDLGYEYGEMNDFYQFDPKTNKWTQLNDFPGAKRSGAVGFSMNGKGYVGLGYSFSNEDNYYTDFWEYDPATDDWERLPDFPGAGRSSAIGFGLDGECFIGLGSVNDFYKYNVKSKTWESLNYLPGSTRYRHVSFLVTNTIYYGGGSYSFTPYSDVWKYQIKSATGIHAPVVQRNNLVSPNPVKDKFQIIGLDGMATVSIYDMNGREVYKQTQEAREMFSAGHLHKGMYIVKVNVGDNAYSTKMVKE